MKYEGYNQPFTRIGPYYDQLMHFVNYPSWINYIEKILALNNIREKEILDLACGTGVCLELWVKKGYRVIGIDVSQSMLEVCQQRFLEGQEVRLIQADMRDFKLEKRIAIVTCLYDSCNYLLEEEDLFRCFQCVFQNLLPDGIFIFDMNTIHALADEWGNQTFTRKDDAIYSTWSNTYDPTTGISSLRLTLNVYEPDSEKTLKEFHQERGYALLEIGKLLSRAGFTYSLYRHLTFTPATESDTRIMAVARKPWNAAG